MDGAGTAPVTDGAASCARDGAPEGVACAVIVAGGSGTRFGNPGGKLLVEAADRPLIAWTLAAFDRARTIGHIVIVCQPARRQEMREAAIDPYPLATPVAFADAGAERQDSTVSGVAAVPAGYDVIAIHDAARPLISPATIDVAVAELLRDPRRDGVVCGQAAIDTLKTVEEQEVGTRFVDTPPRSRFWCVQTPQVFRTHALVQAIEHAAADGFEGTDDASVVEHVGGVVVGVEAPRDNIKVTVPEDLPLVEALLRARTN